MSTNRSEQFIFGPSHAVRLRHALATRQLPPLAIPSRIIGVGGMPIWNPLIRKEIATANPNHEAFFIVGDFRFGNKLLEDPNFNPEAPQEKVYLSIAKELINEENDRILFNLCLATLESLKRQLGGRLRLLFWDLSIREYQNRATGRYQETGAYRHPVWNLDDVLKQFADIAIDTRAFLDVGERLFIDSSAHPSLAGWLYIAKYLRGDAYVDLPTELGNFDCALKKLLAGILAKDTVLITGDSKFVRSLSFFVQNKHFQLPTGWVIRPLAKAIDAEPFQHCLYFPNLCTFEMGEPEIADGIGKVLDVRDRLVSKHKKVSVLHYDNWAYEAISKRKDYLNKYIPKHPNGLTASLELATCPNGQSYKISDSTEFEGMIELNNTLLPTTLGILEILCRSTTDAPHGLVMAAYSRFIDDCHGDAAAANPARQIDALAG